MRAEVECHKVEAYIAMQAPATLFNKNIDGPDDGDLLMFHGKTFHYLSFNTELEQLLDCLVTDKRREQRK